MKLTNTLIPKQTSKKALPVINSRVLAFLQQQLSGVIATVDSRGNPHASVVYYSADDDYTIRFLTKQQTTKSKNLQRDNRCSFVVYDEMAQTTVQAIGRAKPLTGEDDIHDSFIKTLVSSLQTSENGIPPISKLSAGDYIVYELKPTRLTMASYAWPYAKGFNVRRELIKLPQASAA